MPTDQQQLTELKALADGGAFVWPVNITMGKDNFQEGGVEVAGTYTWVHLVCYDSGTIYLNDIDNPDSPWWKHALTLVIKAAEDSLVDGHNKREGTTWERHDLLHRVLGFHNDSLPDALRAEQERKLTPWYSSPHRH